MNYLFINVFDLFQAKPTVTIVKLQLFQFKKFTVIWAQKNI